MPVGRGVNLNVLRTAIVLKKYPNRPAVDAIHQKSDFYLPADDFVHSSRFLLPREQSSEMIGANDGESLLLLPPLMMVL